jgi:hypothetical protein
MLPALLHGVEIVPGTAVMSVGVAVCMQGQQVPLSWPLSWITGWSSWTDDGGWYCCVTCCCQGLWFGMSLHWDINGKPLYARVKHDDFKQRKLQNKNTTLRTVTWWMLEDGFHCNQATRQVLPGRGQAPLCAQVLDMSRSLPGQPLMLLLPVLSS